MPKLICRLELLTTTVYGFGFFFFLCVFSCSVIVVLEKWGMEEGQSNLQFTKFVANFKIGKSNTEILYLHCDCLIHIPPCKLGTQKTRGVPVGRYICGLLIKVE